MVCVCAGIGRIIKGVSENPAGSAIVTILSTTVTAISALALAVLNPGYFIISAVAGISVGLVAYFSSRNMYDHERNGFNCFLSFGVGVLPTLITKINNFISLRLPFVQGPLISGFSCGFMTVQCITHLIDAKKQLIPPPREERSSWV